MSDHSHFLSELHAGVLESKEEVKTADLEELGRDPLHTPRDPRPWSEGLEMRGRNAEEADARSEREPTSGDATRVEPDATRVEFKLEKPTPELKPLPANLRYEFLDSDHSFPVIINADLTPDHTTKLLEKLKLH